MSRIVKYIKEKFTFRGSGTPKPRLWTHRVRSVPQQGSFVYIWESEYRRQFERAVAGIVKYIKEKCTFRGSGTPRPRLWSHRGCVQCAATRIVCCWFLGGSWVSRIVKYIKEKLTIRGSGPPKPPEFSLINY